MPQTLSVFDEIINQTTARYTSGDLTRLLGRADALAIHAVTTLVAGTAPTLRIQVEHSADGRVFVQRVSGVPEIPATAISNDAAFTGTTWLGVSLLAYVRLAITLGGTSPLARVRVFVTGHLQ